jgi:hypothetical protein
MAKSQRERIDELEDELKQRDRRIAELKADATRLEDVITRQAEAVEDSSNLIDSWIEAFDMVLGDDGLWSSAPWWATADEASQKYAALVRKWNAAVADFNAVYARKRNVGRPLAASDTQAEQVRKLHKQGMSLRSIVDETSLGLRTVRTIIDQGDRKDRTTRKYLERIKPDMQAERAWKSRKRTRDAIPKRIAAFQKIARELKQEARGLGR